MLTRKEDRNGRNMCRGLFSHQVSVRKYLYSPAKSRTIMYIDVMAPMNRTTETTSIQLDA